MVNMRDFLTLLIAALERGIQFRTCELELELELENEFWRFGCFAIISTCAGNNNSGFFLA